MRALCCRSRKGTWRMCPQMVLLLKLSLRRRPRKARPSGAPGTGSPPQLLRAALSRSARRTKAPATSLGYSAGADCGVGQSEGPTSNVVGPECLQVSNGSTSNVVGPVRLPRPACSTSHALGLSNPCAKPFSTPYSNLSSQLVSAASERWLIQHLMWLARAWKRKPGQRRV